MWFHPSVPPKMYITEVVSGDISLAHLFGDDCKTLVEGYTCGAERRTELATSIPLLLRMSN